MSMKTARLTILFCWAALACVWIVDPALATATDEKSDLAAAQQLLADEIKRRNHLAQDLSAKHLLARLRADELLAEHKFTQARLKRKNG